jgi:putative nucleotidyltransferase with HDIG domain
MIPAVPTPDTDPRLAHLARGVEQSLPEAQLISDPELRRKVIGVWAFALSQTEFERIEDMPRGDPGEAWMLEPITMADHMRATATIALGMADGFERIVGPTRIDRDLLIASALLHDVGKPWEMSPRNEARWRADPAATGSPSFRHSGYGIYLCLTYGLPETVAHTAGYHSGGGEGEWITRSLENTIVYLADLAFWKMMERVGLMEGEIFDPATTIIKYGIHRPRTPRCGT